MSVNARIRVLAAFDVGDQSFRVGQVTELPEPLAARLVHLRIATLAPESLETEAAPTKDHGRRKA